MLLIRAIRVNPRQKDSCGNMAQEQKDRHESTRTNMVGFLIRVHPRKSASNNALSEHGPGAKDGHGSKRMNTDDAFYPCKSVAKALLPNQRARFKKTGHGSTRMNTDSLPDPRASA